MRAVILPIQPWIVKPKQKWTYIQETTQITMSESTYGFAEFVFFSFALVFVTLYLLETPFRDSLSNWDTNLSN